MSCAQCNDTGWTCEKHPDKPMGHDGCGHAGDPCPACNEMANNEALTPRLPPDFKVDYDKDGGSRH